MSERVVLVTGRRHPSACRVADDLVSLQLQQPDRLGGIVGQHTRLAVRDAHAHPRFALLVAAAHRRRDLLGVVSETPDRPARNPGRDFLYQSDRLSVAGDAA